MNISLRIVTSSVLGIAVFAVLLFIPAGTVSYWQGWAVLAVFSVASLVPTLYLARIDPAAFERRTHAGVRAESRPVQKIVIAGTFLAFGALLVVPALDYRFGWSHVPAWLSVVGDVMVAVGLGLTMWVVVQNRYASANITIEDGQPLVSTGLYGIVRHPMYTGNVILMIGIALALGSYWALLLVVVGLLLMAVRIFDEEKLLRTELDGYQQYTQKVRYRLIPLIW
ncbi:isoprenylcysteine carboxylmethyltransferase family protein [Mycobacterium sp. CVI_P3]|uniref:Isoprenylcysteine carboxylmethyltransferase family protein n=1 Tax=Mycobacterium pinniadriaticum TaxID=2994102 RepID=A0ABT3SCU3_9MYCO|nr:isoprenylcysteine carboxylmethyltransferase family protein [Mycobacterium pinniadriaticum]MCX2930758.1 isoprenylcysteine carboxylmethyltransferase family protein [Mycobacterium pinniadriaticum]MCX2937182.1 isoprenylcysteine carboxylmethyltransferase family protein [Mycobacterium pinniadriaticum]